MNNEERPAVGILGAGHLGSAVIAGLRLAGWGDKLQVYDPQPADASIAATLTIAASEQALADQCSYLFLCVRPVAALQLLRSLDARGKVLISAVAGLSAAQIAELTQAYVLRIMPNLPVSLGEGAIAYDKNNNLPPEELAGALRLLRCLGAAVPVEEAMFAAVTGLSGSGPAYVYVFLESLIRAGISLGLDGVQAADLAIQTVRGAAALVQESPHADLAAMIRAVATPGGTTEAGVRVLEGGRFRQTVADAVTAAAQRAKELLG